jgi:hypothetical protein
MKTKPKIPNATTIKAMKAVDRGKGRRFKNAEALLKDLGISNKASARHSER